MSRRQLALWLLVYISGCVATGLIIGLVLASALRRIDVRVQSLEYWRSGVRNVENDGGR